MPVSMTATCPVGGSESSAARASPSGPHAATMSSRSAISRSVAASRYARRRSQLPPVQSAPVMKSVAGR